MEEKESLSSKLEKYLSDITPEQLEADRKFVESFADVGPNADGYLEDVSKITLVELLREAFNSGRNTGVEEMKTGEWEDGWTKFLVDYQDEIENLTKHG